ncbi:MULTISPECIES: hypothetical protein [Bacillaceae]|uniref:hypothetical protein n=1 Tax=Bacillaceae TaxID=186817 RepID=UPI002FFEEE99
MWKNKGYFLLELLLSMSALFMICLTFIPLFIQLKKQSDQFAIENKARHLLFNELHEKLSGSTEFNNTSIKENGIVYTISWDNAGTPEKKEACIKIDKTIYRNEPKICETLE